MVYPDLKRFWNLALDSIEKDIPATKEMEKTRHKMVYDITSRLEAFSLNTVVSGFMEYTNKLIAIAKQNDGAVDKETIKTVTILLAPFVPHIAEEIVGGSLVMRIPFSMHSGRLTMRSL